MAYLTFAFTSIHGAKHRKQDYASECGESCFWRYFIALAWTIEEFSGRFIRKDYSGYIATSRSFRCGMLLRGPAPLRIDNEYTEEKY